MGKKGEEGQACSALLLGRNTYKSFARDWPKIEEFAMYNAIPKYVVSTTLTDDEATWENTTIIGSDAPQRVAALRDQHDGEIQVHGSGTLAQSLIDADLVDELRLMVFPIILGDGKRLFGSTGGKKKLRQTQARAVGEGVTILVYER
ncbi:MAG TPA: dihydrofolate reductase family protein [Candidatus Limnocylindrales bacterium]